MSHKIPTTIIGSNGSGNFVIYTDAGSISVSGAFSLLGDPSITTFASGTAVYITSGAPPSAVTFQADSGTASSQAGILKIVTPPIIPQYITTTATGNTISVQGNLVDVLHGGTGQTSLTLNSLLYGRGTAPIGLVPVGTNGQVLLSSTGGPPNFGTISSTGGTLTFAFGPNSLNIDINLLSSFFNPLPVENGSTGRTILTAYGVLIGQGTLPVHVTDPGTDGQLLIASTTGDPKFATITSTGGTVTFSFGHNSLNIDVSLGSFTLATGNVPIDRGGTGRTILTSHGVLIGQGTLPVNVTAPGTNGQVLIGSTTGDPAFATITSSNGTLTFTAGPNSLNIEIDVRGFSFLSIQAPIDKGGTGRTILTNHGVLIGQGTLPVNVTDPGTNGQAFIASTTGDPKFSTITSTGGTLTFSFGPNSLNIDVNLTGSTFFNPISPENGGTGRSILTAYGVLIGQGTLPINVTAPGTDGQALIASTTGDPKFSTITSTGGTLTFSFGHNSLNIDVNWSGSTLFNPIPVQNGSTGRTVLTAYGVLIGAGTLPVNVTAPGTDGQVLIASTTGDPKFSTITSTGQTLTFISGHNSLNIDINLSSLTFIVPFPVSSGGTGQTILTAYGVLIGEGSLPIHVTAAGTDGQTLIASSTGDPSFATITSTGNTLTFSFGHNSLNIDLANANGLIILGNIGTATPNNAYLTIIGTSPVTTVGTGSTLFIQLDTTGSFFNPLQPANGGLGQTVLTTHGVLIGAGSLPVHVTDPGTNGQMLIAATTGDPKFATITSTGGTVTFSFGSNSLNIDVNVSGITLFNPTPVQRGGTGQTILTTFGVLIGEGSNDINVTDPGTNGQVLIGSTTGDPKFATITSTGGSLTFSFGNNSLNIDVNFSGTFFNPLPVANGSTGRTILTTYGVLIGAGSLPVHVTDPGTNGQVLIASTTGDPKFATITSTGNSLTFSFGVNSLNIDINWSNTFINPLQVSNGGTGNTVLTTFGVLIGEGSLPIHVTDSGTNGQVLIAATLADPKFSTITSTGNSLTFTFGPNSLNIDVNFSNTFLNPLQVVNGGTGQTALTAFGVLIGEGSLSIHATDPGTDGQVLIASSTGDPAFSTITSTGNTLTFSFGHNSLNIEVNLSSSYFNPLQVSNGGTGLTSFTPYAVICGGTSSTSALQSISSLGTLGQVLTSNGPGALPSFEDISIGPVFSGINVLTFTASGTYTPSSGLIYCTIECVGGGGGGGGVIATLNANSYGAAGGGGGGGYSRTSVPAASIGVSQSVTIGAGGTAGSTAGGTGGTGGTTAVGLLLNASGGTGGTSSSQTVASRTLTATGGNAGVGSGGEVNSYGEPGGTGWGLDQSGSIRVLVSGSGGDSYYGGGAAEIGLTTSFSEGITGSSNGAGGSGGVIASIHAGVAGGAGANGVVIITEYV